MSKNDGSRIEKKGKRAGRSSLGTVALERGTFHQSIRALVEVRCRLSVGVRSSRAAQRTAVRAGSRWPLNAQWSSRGPA